MSSLSQDKFENKFLKESIPSSDVWTIILSFVNTHFCDFFRMQIIFLLALILPVK